MTRLILAALLLAPNAIALESVDQPTGPVSDIHGLTREVDGQPVTLVLAFPDPDGTFRYGQQPTGTYRAWACNVTYPAGPLLTCANGGSDSLCHAELDFDGNGLFDAFDWDIFVQDLAASVTGYNVTDLNCDGIVDGLDISVFIDEMEGQ